MNEKQTVVIFSTAYLPFIGGAELAIKEITDRIPDLHFILFTARMRHDLPRRERVGNVDVYRVGVGIPLLDKILSPFLAAWHVLHITRHRHICLFWSIMVSYITITPALFNMFGLYKKIPFLLTLQEGDSEEHLFRARAGLVAFWWRRCLRYANHVQVISVYLGKLARDFGYTGPMSVVPNGVDIKKFSISPAAFKEKIIITVSRLVEKNGVDTLIRAFAEVHKKFPDAKLHIVGDGVLRRELENLTQTLGVGKSVTFLGNVSNEQVPNHLAQSYMFVRPSRSEGLGTAFLEAMAQGLPVIGTPVGGIVDFLKDGETGLICKIDDYQHLSLQIEQLFADETLYKKLQENGRRLIEERYDWNSIGQKMNEIFIRLIYNS